MGVIQMIYPNNSDTRSRLGIDIFEQVGPSAPDAQGGAETLHYVFECCAVQQQSLAICSQLWQAAQQERLFLNIAALPAGVSCPQPALRSGALDTVKRRQVVMNGPLKLVQGNFGTISRIPIFLEGIDLNETWGNNKSRECTLCSAGQRARTAVHHEPRCTACLGAPRTVLKSSSWQT